MTYMIAYPVDAPDKAVVTNLDRPLDEALEALPGDWDGRPIDVAEQLRDVPVKALVGLHNRANPEAPVTKFENRTVAARRVFPVLGTLVREDHGTITGRVTEEKPKTDAAPKPKRGTALLEMLQREGGTTVPEITEAFGWQPHTARAAISGLRKGHTVTTEKVEGRGRVYYIAS